MGTSMWALSAIHLDNGWPLPERATDVLKNLGYLIFINLEKIINPEPGFQSGPGNFVDAD